jgi:hypothetical protein
MFFITQVGRRGGQRLSDLLRPLRGYGQPPPGLSLLRPYLRGELHSGYSFAIVVNFPLSQRNIWIIKTEQKTCYVFHNVLKNINCPMGLEGEK